MSEFDSPDINAPLETPVRFRSKLPNIDRILADEQRRVESEKTDSSDENVTYDKAEDVTITDDGYDKTTPGYWRTYDRAVNYDKMTPGYWRNYDRASS
jgi:hypothetical protein